MTVSGVGAAFSVGMVIGVLGWLASPGRSGIPVWLMLAVGVSAALLGEIATGLVRDGTPRLDWYEVLVHAGFATLGVSAVATTARAHPPGSRS